MIVYVRYFVFCLLLMARPVVGQELVFKGGGAASPWTVDGSQLLQDIAAGGFSSTVTIPFGDKECEVSEEGFRYFPVSLKFTVPDEGFAGTEDTLARNRIAIDLNVVFTVRENRKYVVDLDKGSMQSPFSVGRQHRLELEGLSTTKGLSANDYVTGLIHALILVRYYEELLDSISDNPDRDLWLARKTRYAVIAANLLMQLHNQDESNGRFSLDPIILPEGDAYTMLKASLEGRPVSLKTVTETRYRMFWYLSDRLTGEDLRNKSVQMLKAGSPALLNAARQISDCLTDKNINLNGDSDLYAYLEEMGFYVPSLNHDLLMVPASKPRGKRAESFNLWYNLYVRDNTIPEKTLEWDTVKEKIFGE